MKQNLVKLIRDNLPQFVVKFFEEIYRYARVYLISMKYSFPARGQHIIAVTGTNGKTTTACYINEILKAAGKKTSLFTTAVIEVDNQSKINDLNMTVASIEITQKFLQDSKNAGVDFVILEITSHALDQHKLATIPVECAVMTNLTRDHLDYHHDMNSYANAKSKLFSGRPKFIVLNRDDPWFDIFDDFEALERKVSYGVNNRSNCQIKNVKLYKRGSETNLEIDGEIKLELATLLPGKYNVYNLTAAASVAYLYQVSPDVIRDGVANLEPVPGRFEVIKHKLFDVVVDYAHTPDALEQLLTTTKQITKGEVWLVFGACGDRDKTKRPIMGEIAAKFADHIVLTDEENYNEDPQEIRNMLREGIISGSGEAKATEYPDRREAIRFALNKAKKGDTILITGMGHEQYRIINGQRQHWNDSEVIKDLMTQLP
jgi:UDP-N-acetylmuramoyl-L-alanyl-D-glutamate--2,6-diaminopimelate ligase